MEPFAIGLFIVGGILILIAFILILVLCYRARWRKRKEKQANDSFRVLYRPSKPPAPATKPQQQYVVASNGTLVSSKPRTMERTHADGVTLIPATVVIPSGSTLSLDRREKKSKHRGHSDSTMPRVVYGGSHLGTTMTTGRRVESRHVSSSSSRHQHSGGQRYAASYAYGTSGNPHHRSTPELGPLVLQGDIRSGRLQVLGEVPRDRQVRKWLHRQNSSELGRASSNDALDADQPSLPDEVFDSSGTDPPKSPNALVLRWSPSMGRRVYKRRDEVEVDSRTLPAHVERRYVYPQYQSGKAMSSL